MATFQDARKRNKDLPFPELRPMCDDCSTFVDGFAQQAKEDTCKRVWTNLIIGSPCISCGVKL